ncbi:acetyl-CoA carboxylase biotin carboxyl carrier protein subunit [Thermococcus alcaliphilus]|uniref:acetyl-CoA carboxylase biotin carboxyl carrier protein subunit n=1 Tax=Thermococcus alcaliphilus TaxID=139207 RepID=UPI002091C21E|nr:acetyl-CoA carboxylase biotin carboxyl carrier protein subunit [Thermococcus alcaliphilus]MCO6041752.1 acetyl-CoA carboxylase biotin carboxyl carrier protein subunit [Thermococcus alcaliphilus]
MKGKVKVIVDGVPYEVEVEELGGGKFKVSFEGESYEVEAKDLGISMGALQAPSAAPVQVGAPVATPAPAPAASAPVGVPSAPASVAGENVVSAPMPGKILRVLVREGDQVRVGQGLLILEAMKMENEIPSPKDGVVKRILVKEGDTVDTGQPLIELG